MDNGREGTGVAPDNEGVKVEAVGLLESETRREDDGEVDVDGVGELTLVGGSESNTWAVSGRIGVTPYTCRGAIVCDGDGMVFYRDVTASRKRRARGEEKCVG